MVGAVGALHPDHRVAEGRHGRLGFPRPVLDRPQVGEAARDLRAVVAEHLAAHRQHLSEHRQGAVVLAAQEVHVAEVLEAPGELGVAVAAELPDQRHRLLDQRRRLVEPTLQHDVDAEVVERRRGVHGVAVLYGAPDPELLAGQLLGQGESCLQICSRTAWFW